MLKHLTISGFKSIRKAEIDFGRVNMFIGGNGSGKSNILEALGVLSAALKDVSMAELRRHGVRQSPPVMFKSAFRNLELKHYFKLESSFDGNVHYDVSIQAGQNLGSLRYFSERFRVDSKSYLGRGQNGVRVESLATNKRDIDETRGLWDRFREVVDVPEVLEVELNRMGRFAIYSPQTPFLRGVSSETDPLEPVGLFGTGLPRAADALQNARASLGLRVRLGKAELSTKLELFLKILNIVRAPGWNHGFSVARFNPELVSTQVQTSDALLYFIDKHMKRGRDRLSAYDASEGTLYLLFMAVLILHPDVPKIFALDNVDNALNPAMTTRMLSTLIEATCSPEFKEEGIGPEQVFLTSHNPTALDAFDLFDDDQRVFVVSRSDKTGETVVTRLKPAEGWTRTDWIKAAGGKALSELWIEDRIKGALGG